MKTGPLILAALTALVLALRWRQLPTQSRALAALAVIALAVWGSGVIHPPNLETVARDIGATLGAYTYALVGLLAFLETGAGIGLIAPGELAVVIGGVTAGQGHTNLVWLIGVVWACAVAGDIASYALGRRLGRPFLLKYGAPLKLTPQRLEQVEGFLRRHGRKTIIVGRFIGVVRALAPFTAGSTNMPARRFVPAVFVAAGIWAAAFTTLGYVFWQSFNEASALAKQGTFALLALVVLVVLLVAAYRNLRNPERRRRLRARLRTLPIAGRLRGQGSHQQGMNRLALPSPLVNRPSSSTWTSTFHTSGCAFSTSSSRITEYGPRLRSSVGCPALAVADVPRRGTDQPGERLRRAVLGHVDSHRRLPANSRFASAFTSSVLPTPVTFGTSTPADRSHALACSAGVFGHVEG
jgi:membrane protein DedA with SNARE-associated domain